MPRSHPRRANSRGHMPGLRALPLTLCELFSGQLLRHTSFESRWDLLSASINRWVLARGSTAKTIYSPRRSTTRVRGIVHLSADRELLGQALVEQRAVGRKLVVRRTSSRVVSSATTHSVVITERQRRR